MDKRWAVVDCQEEKNEIHVMPVEDIKPHVDTPLCLCKPKFDAGTPKLWVHNAWYEVQ